jgi:hypothetical protein
MLVDYVARGCRYNCDGVQTLDIVRDIRERRAVDIDTVPCETGFPFFRTSRLTGDQETRRQTLNVVKRHSNNPCQVNNPSQ